MRTGESSVCGEPGGERSQSSLSSGGLFNEPKRTSGGPIPESVAKPEMISSSFPKFEQKSKRTLSALSILLFLVFGACVSGWVVFVLKCKAAKGEIAEAEAKFSERFEKEKANMKIDMERFQTKNADINENLKILEAEKLSLEGEKTDLGKKVKSLEAEKQVLKDQVSECNTKINEMETALEKEKEQVGIFEKQVGNFDKRIVDATDLVEDLKVKLKQKDHEILTMTKKTQQEAQQKEQEMAEKRRTAVQEAVNKKEEEMIREVKNEVIPRFLGEKQDEIEHLRGIITGLRNENIRMQREAASREKELHRRKEELEELNEDNNSLTDENVQLNVKISKLLQANKDQSTDLEKKKSDLTEAKEEYRRLKQERDELKAQLESI